MALMKCPECGKEVSTSANACPHCGYPLKPNEEDKNIVKETEHLSKVYLKNQKHYMIGELIVAVILIIIGILMFILLGFVTESGPDPVFIGVGISITIIGVIGLIYYRHRLKNF